MFPGEMVYVTEDLPSYLKFWRSLSLYSESCCNSGNEAEDYSDSLPFWN